MTENFSQIRAFFRDYISYSLRTWLLFAMVMVLGSIIGLLAYSISGYQVTRIFPSESVFSSAMSVSSYFYICWTVTFMCSFAISNDFTTNASSFILALPVKRSNIFAGRFLGAMTITAISTATLYVVFALESLYYFGNVTPSLLLSYLVALLFIASVSALVFLLSSLIKIDRIVLIFSFVVLFVIFPILEGVFQTYSLNINTLLIYNALAMTRSIHAFGNFTYFGFSLVSIVTVSAKPFNYAESIISMLIYFVIFFVLGMATYSRRQVL